MEYEKISPEDRETVERQLNREVRGRVFAASRCPYAEVEVIVTPPLLPDGTPFPTLFWLTCPLLHREVSRLESGDFREGLRRKSREEPGFSTALREAEVEYAGERERLAEETGEAEKVRDLFADRDGIAGTVAGGIKCLHAHLAHYLAGGDNPVGAEVARALRGLQVRKCGGDCGPFLRKDPA